MGMKRIRYHIINSLLSYTMTLGIASLAYALPVSLNNTGSATITTNGNQMNIAGKGLNNILMWGKFNVGAGEVVNFADRNNYLNLVQGGDISRIYGTLRGGNIVYLVNPNGILFGEGARIDNMGSFIASTRNISSINKNVFLENPGLVQNVLGVDSEVMDNQRYYSTNSPKNKISMADLQLTNVPENGGLVLLDGPGGVILKNKAQLDKVTQVITRKNGGEVGIGTENGSVSLSESDKSKIVLVDGDNYSPYNESVLQPYKIITNLNDLQSINILHDSANTGAGSVLRNAPYGHYLLGNSINASGLAYSSVFAKGDFDGLGYSIDNLSIRDDRNFYVGLFGEYHGNIRNLSINNISINAICGFAAGGVAGAFHHGSINNVSVSGVIKSHDIVGGLVGAVGTSYDFLQDHNVEIRNSKNSAFLTKSTDPKHILIGQSGTFTESMGGLVGNTLGSLKTVSIYNSVNTGDIEREEVYNAKIGGIIANTQLGKIKIVDTYNLGNISCSNPYLMRMVIIGGIVGGDSPAGYTNYGKLPSYELDNVYNLGTIKMNFNIQDDSYLTHVAIVGDIIGLNNVNKNITNAYYIKNSIVHKGSLVTGNAFPFEDSRDFDIRYDLPSWGIYTIKEGVGETVSQIKNKLNPDLFGLNGTFEDVWLGKSFTPGNNENIPSDPNSNNNNGNNNVISNNPGSNDSGNGSFNPNKEYFEALPNKDQISSAVDNNMQKLEEFKQQYKSDVVEVDQKPNIKYHYRTDDIINMHEKDMQKVDNFFKSQLNAIKEAHTNEINSIIGNELKKDIVISDSTILKWQIPSGLYDAFLEPIIKKLKDSNISEYNSKLGYNFMFQIMNAVSKGLEKIPSKTVNIDGIEYTINYDMALAQNNITTVVANVTWLKDGKNQKVTMTLSNYDSPEAINSYVKSLKKLTEDVVENAMLEFASYGLQDLVGKNTIKKSYEFGKKLVMAMVDKDSAEAFLKSLGEYGVDYLLEDEKILGLIPKSAPDKVKDLVGKVFGGAKKFKKFVETVEALNEKKEAYVDALRKSQSGDYVDNLKAEYFFYKESVEKMLIELQP